MHAGNLFGDHTTGSYCGEINRLYFVTGASFPCMAVFKPISRAATVLPLDETTARRYWLKRELLHRHAMCDIGLEAEYRTEGSKLEAFYWDKSQSTTDDKALDALSTQAFAAEERLVNDLLRSAHKTSLRFGGNLYYIQRGSILEIEGKKLLCFGGAESWDKEDRDEGINWWRAELPTSEELKTCADNLEAAGWQVDYILTHDAPLKILEFAQLMQGQPNWLHTFFGQIMDKAQYKKWLFGRYHKDRKLGTKTQAVFCDVIPLED